MLVKPQSLGTPPSKSLKATGAWLVRHALEQLPVSFTFGIPGVHNTELYDQLAQSERIRPTLVTHECSAAFMADAISRTRPGEIGVLAIVPAAGVTHAMSGIAEAFLDGIPMLIITGGVRTDIQQHYQIHQIEQQDLLRAVTKRCWKIGEADDIVATIFEAFEVAMSGVPGPVLVEVPVNIQLFRRPVPSPAAYRPSPRPELDDSTFKQLDHAAELLAKARHPSLFVGWGAVDVVDAVREIADLLGAPVSTTLQGLSAFPGNHPLFAGMGFGPAAVPAAENAFARCDGMLAIGTRFAEIPTGSFSCTVPAALVHIDIDPQVPGRNFPAQVPLIGDARVLVPALAERLRARIEPQEARRRVVVEQIARDREAYAQEWLKHRTDRVNPQRFFTALRKALDDDAIVVADDGNHTFLVAELMPIHAPRGYLSPSDFNCMGYCVPAAIGAKLASARRQVVGIVGDGAFLMTGMELLTASANGVGVMIFVFHDGELSQIAQGQELPYNRKTCTVIGSLQVSGVATATGAHFVAMPDDASIEAAIKEALYVSAQGRPVVVDVAIDYSKRTRFTKGVVKSVLKRFPLGERLRFVGRAVTRHIMLPKT